MFKENSLVTKALEYNNIPESEWDSIVRKDSSLRWPTPVFEREILKYFSELKESQSLICIHGDYDCDGMTGSTVLYQYLKGAGFNVVPFLPTRHIGYGLNKSTIDKFANDGCKALITVDCGISNRDEINYAKELGIETVVTDHHSMPTLLPEAKFTLHPGVLGLKDCENLAGVGVAYWLTQILSKEFKSSFNHYKYIGLVAIGTIGDLTPLRGFNRQVVKHGLEALRLSPLPAIAAMKDVCKISDIDEETLAFQIIPRLNAAGRMDTPMQSFAMLNTPEEHHMNKMALRLNAFNDDRKDLCKAVETSVISSMVSKPSDRVVIEWTSYPHGVIGITAAQICEKFHLPCFMMSREGDLLKGSARSPEWYHCKKALDACSDLLGKYGGHTQAAGFSLPFAKLEEFRARLIEYSQSVKPPSDGDIKTIALHPSMATLAGVKELDILKPFGSGLKKPIFKASFEVEKTKAIGETGAHVSGFTSGHKVVWFNSTLKDMVLNDDECFLYTLDINTYRNVDSVNINIKGKTKK